MTASIRYKFVNNLTTGPYTYNNFPVQGDGDDKIIRVVRRVLGPQDIGTAAGQSRNALGLIIDIIPKSYNVLFVQGILYRPSAAIVGIVTPYSVFDNQFQGGHEADILYLVNSDNSVRAKDFSDDALSYIAAGDVIIATIGLGPVQNKLDVINY